MPVSKRQAACYRVALSVGNDLGRRNPEDVMTQSTRKLVGIPLTLIVLVVYAGLATMLYMQFLTGATEWVLLVYFSAAGLLWAVPVSFIIRWMARPD
jgi:hypothetical protein